MKHLSLIVLYILIYNSTGPHEWRITNKQSITVGILKDDLRVNLTFNVVGREKMLIIEFFFF